MEGLYKLKSQIKKILDFSFEDFAFFIFSASIICTVLGPVVHYSLWPLTLITLIYGKIRHNTNILPQIHPLSKNAFIFFLLFVFWASLPNIFTAKTTYIWAHGVSCYAEIALGVLFTMRILNSEEKLEKFLKWFVILNALFSVGYALSLLTSFHMPNGSMQNNNVSGHYACLVMPFIIWYSFDKVKNTIARLALCLSSLLIILTSTSSGAWLAALVQGLLLLYFIIKYKKITLKSLALFAILALISLTVFNFATKNQIPKMIMSELTQAESVTTGNLNQLTNHRYDIWRATILMAREHPFVGFGRKSYESEYNLNIPTFKKEIVGFERIIETSHAHSMYLETLFSGGIPALLSFCAMYILLISLCIKSIKTDNTMQKSFAIICLISLIGNAILGTNGDIFEGRRDLATTFYAVIGITLLLPKFKNNTD
ncbi:MAG: O-antigen ligase family protein [Synergistaceae bacterium]